jgi:glyoxylase-like metal-dependent hydrolase (beta-lactamase superfamily II)
MVAKFGEMSVEQTVLLEWGDVVSVGDLRLQWLDARGHGPFHGAFFDRERGWLFAGDVVLATPTPISRAMDDDLELYRTSLDRLEALDASLLLPGHGVQRGGDLSRAFSRARGYVEHYEKEVRLRLEQASSPRGVYDIAIDMTPDGRPFRPSARWWVHLALIDSHLFDLIRRGLAERLEQPDGPRYQLAH